MNHGLTGIISRIVETARRLPGDRQGVTAVEYGVLAALIVVVCLVSINNLGQIVLTNLYNEIANATRNALTR